jgi:hypothetical protein
VEEFSGWQEPIPGPPGTEFRDPRLVQLRDEPGSTKYKVVSIKIGCPIQGPLLAWSGDFCWCQRNPPLNQKMVEWGTRITYLGHPPAAALFVVIPSVVEGPAVLRRARFARGPVPVVIPSGAKRSRGTCFLPLPFRPRAGIFVGSDEMPRPSRRS